MITKARCQEIFYSKMLAKNLVELSSDESKDFCDAVGEAIHETLIELQNELNSASGYAATHQHTCAAPGSPTAALPAPVMFLFVE